MNKQVLKKSRSTLRRGNKAPKPGPDKTGSTRLPSPQKARKPGSPRYRSKPQAGSRHLAYPVGPTLRLTHMFGGVATYFPGEVFPNRTLNDYEIVWIIAGGAKYTHDGVTHQLTPGDVILARPGFVEHYNWAPDKTSRHGFFHFDIKTLPQGWTEPSQWPVQKKFPPGHALTAMLEHLLERWRVAGYARVPTDTRLESILQAALEVYFWDPKTGVDENRLSEPVVRAIDYLRGMLRVEGTRRLTLDQTARAAGVSAKHLCRCFADELAVSPMTYYRLLRLESAMARLVGTGQSLKQISQDFGFSSPYHFSRCFTQAYGASPSAVRRDFRAGITPPTGPLSRL